MAIKLSAGNIYAVNHEGSPTGTTMVKIQEAFVASNGHTHYRGLNLMTDKSVTLKSNRRVKNQVSMAEAAEYVNSIREGKGLKPLTVSQQSAKVSSSGDTKSGERIQVKTPDDVPIVSSIPKKFEKQYYTKSVVQIGVNGKRFFVTIPAQNRMMEVPNYMVAKGVAYTLYQYLTKANENTSAKEETVLAGV